MPTAFFASVADTTDADMIGSSHQISTFNYHVTRGPGQQAAQYGQEFRVRQEDGSGLGEYVAVKHVIEPSSSNEGALGAYILEQFDDMQEAVTHVERIERQFLDRRMITYHAGGEIRIPEVVQANYVLRDQDSGKDFFILSASNLTITVPNTLTDGFRARFFQVASGKAVFSFGALDVAEPDGLRETQGVGHQASLGVAASANLAFLALTKNPVKLHAGTRPGRTYGPYGRNTLLPIVNNALNANVLYPVPILVSSRITLDAIGVRVTTALASQNLRLALFASNGAGLPGVRLYQTGSISTATVGDKQAAGIGLALQPGMYFLAVVSSGGVQIPWSCNDSLDEVYGRPSSTGLEILPLYASTIGAIPADLSAVTPAAHIDSSNMAPDVYWRAA